MKLNFKVKDDLLIGARRLGGLLGYEISDSGITVTECKGDKVGIEVKSGAAKIYYKQKNQFFRELGILVNHLKDGGEDTVRIEESCFDTLGVMIDASRGAVPTVKTLNNLTDYLALMGYNMVLMYTEDTLELPGRPYFGYMRGRYTVEELRAYDDYAYEYGIEVIPCLECYGHMTQYLRWPEAASIKDTKSVLLAREDKTFEFIDTLISTAASCFRSKRIHIGMDEAWDMGRGEFLDKHGYVHPINIFNEYMERLIGITNKYGLRPMMWSDMYFRVCSKGNRYYEEDIVITDEVKKSIPEGVDLIFWHYGEKAGCDEYMLEKHKQLNRPVIFAGGLWSWIGHFPEHNYALESTSASIKACRKAGVREGMTTLWLNDNAECDIYANLYGLSFTAELCYDENLTKERIAERFEASTGGSADAFYKMSYYHNVFEGVEYPRYGLRFMGKHLFWQDLSEGLFDYFLLKEKRSEHYASAALEMQKAENGEKKFTELYRHAKYIFEYLAEKCYIAENLIPAYKSNDRETLARIASVHLPALKEKCTLMHKQHKKMWYESLKPFAFSGLDSRYGGMEARCDTTRERLEDYLAGRVDTLAEFDEERLYKSCGGFSQYYSLIISNTY